MNYKLFISFSTIPTRIPIRNLNRYPHDSTIHTSADFADGKPLHKNETKRRNVDDEKKKKEREKYQTDDKTEIEEKRGEENRQDECLKSSTY